MATKKKSTTLNKESVKDLTASQRKQIKGGKAKAIISLGPDCTGFHTC